ncbi:hypothetical protein PHJA_001163700 [Phtheirospermum japonicum]|uniref:Transposase n=1 Tax=Phtheirospermum japonicum TaxID=374723 RepID=A0A830BYU9_9LAMI|nr:hypothetical protein PHJA_001163700 [Phtheirospermum japonicum]
MLQNSKLRPVPSLSSMRQCSMLAGRKFQRIPPEGITVENWQVLIDYFESDEFKEVSDRNKRNRDKLKMAHTCGRKSIAQYCYEERDPETGQELTRTSTWIKTRFSNKKKDWIDDASREAYVRGVDTEGPVSEDEAFIKVLGPEKPSRLRGCGDGLKPPSKRGESINQELAKENEELRKQVDANRECTQSLMRENNELASRLESLESQFSQIPTILQNLSQFVQTPSNNVSHFTSPRQGHLEQRRDRLWKSLKSEDLLNILCQTNNPSSPRWFVDRPRSRQRRHDPLMKHEPPLDIFDTPPTIF